MSTVSTRGAPLTPIGSNSAKAQRQTPPVNGDFEALLPTTSAERAKGANRAAQPGKLTAQDRSAGNARQPPDQAPVAPPAESGAVPGPGWIGGDDLAAQPSENAVSTEKPGKIGDPVVPGGTAAPVNAIASFAPGMPQTMRVGTGPEAEAHPAVPLPQSVGPSGTLPVPTEPLARSTGFSDEAVPGHTPLPPPAGEARKAAMPVETAPPSDGGGAARPATIAPTDEALLAAPDAVPAQPISPPAAALSQSVTANPSEHPVETNPAPHPPVNPAGKTARLQVATGVGSAADDKPAPIGPDLNAVGPSPAPLATAPVGTHMGGKPLSDVADPTPLASAGSIAPAAPGVAMAPPGAGSPPAMNANAGTQTQSASRPGAANASPRAIATATAGGPVSPQPALDPTDQGPDNTAVSAHDLLPVAPLPTDTATATAPQSQPHDVRSDPLSSPVVTAGSASPVAPSGPATLPPPVPAAPSAGTVTQQVAVHVAQSLNDGARTVTVELHPAELGRVEIHLSFHADGMNVRMTVDRPETFEALSHDRSGLQQQLAQAGVDLGGGGLDLRLGQQPSDPSGGYPTARTSRVTTPAPQPEGTPATLWVSNSLLDILA